MNIPRRVLGSAVLSALFLAQVAGPASASPRRQVVWVALENADQVAKVDVGAKRVLRRFDTPGGPHNITVAPDGTVVTTLWRSDRIALIRDGNTTFSELGGAPHDAKVARNMVVVANQGSRRIQLVKLDGTLRRRVLLPADPHDLAVDPAGRFAWVSMDGRGDLAVVNLLRRAPVRYVSTGRRPHDLLFAPDGTLWVTDYKGSVDVFSMPRGRLLDTIPLGIEVHHLAFTPDGRFAWITDHGAGRIYELSVRTRRVVASLRFPGEPHHVAITPNGRWAVVADHAHGRLVLFSVVRRRRVGTISVGAGPHGVWAGA